MLVALLQDSPKNIAALHRAYAAATKDSLTSDHLTAAQVVLFGDLNRAHLKAIAAAIAADEQPRFAVQVQAAFEAALAANLVHCSAQVGFVDYSVLHLYV